MEEPGAIDRAAFDALLDSVGGDREFLAELLQTFFEDSPRLLEEMEAALSGGKADEFRRAAHSLKSSSASLGALPLSRICKELEELWKAGSLALAPGPLSWAAAEYARVRPALEALAGLAGSQGV